MGRIVLDLHEIFRNGDRIDSELNRVMDEAVAKKIPTVVIIPGKGSGQLKQRVLRFLREPRIKAMYHRVEVNEKNFGKIEVHFRH